MACRRQNWHFLDGVWASRILFVTSCALTGGECFPGPRKGGFKHTLLRRLEKVDLKARGFRRDGRSRNPKFGSFPKPLQKRTVSWSFWILFCGLWGGVRKSSNVWKCRFKRIHHHRLEKVRLKAFLECLEILRFGCLPKPLQKRIVRWSFWQLFCVLWGGVHKRFKCTKMSD